MILIKTMKKEISEKLLGSTAYGLPNIIRSRRLFNTIYWIFFFIMSLIGASYYIYSDIIDYFNYEVVTVIESKYDQPTQFPTITFCSLKKNIYNSFFPLSPPSFIAFKNEYYTWNGIDPSNHFESFYTVQYGKCFRFNSGKNMSNHSIPIKNSTYGGQLDSFKLTIHAPEGLAVWIHNISSQPKIETNNGGQLNDPIKISPSIYNNIAIERIEESKLEEPYNPCLKDATSFTKNKTIINYLMRENQSYSQEKCLDLCIALFYLNEKPCKCNHSDLGSVWDICDKKDHFCTMNYKDNFTKNILVEMCSNYCPLECDSISFESTVHTYMFDNGRLWSINQSHINVFYKSLKYFSIQQKAKTKPEQLVSNLGGYLGLFVGLSFVSLFEITEVVLEVFFVLCGKRTQHVYEINQSKEDIFALKNQLEEIHVKLNKHELRMDILYTENNRRIEKDD